MRATTVAFHTCDGPRLDVTVTTPGLRTAKKVAVTPRGSATTPLLTGSSTRRVGGRDRLPARARPAGRYVQRDGQRLTHAYAVGTACVGVAERGVGGRIFGACAGRQAGGAAVFAELHPAMTLAATIAAAAS